MADRVRGRWLAGEPSQLATERVQRAPASQESSPLLAPEERLGNVLTGEEGQYGPLTGDATEPAWNGDLLTVACPCGVVLGRVTPEDADLELFGLASLN